MSTLALAIVAGNDDLARKAYEKSKLFSNGASLSVQTYS